MRNKAENKLKKLPELKPAQVKLAKVGRMEWLKTGLAEIEKLMLL